MHLCNRSREEKSTPSLPVGGRGRLLERRGMCPWWCAQCRCPVPEAVPGSLSLFLGQAQELRADCLPGEQSSVKGGQQGSQRVNTSFPCLLIPQGGCLLLKSHCLSPRCLQWGHLLPLPVLSGPASKKKILHSSSGLRNPNCPGGNIQKKSRCQTCHGPTAHSPWVWKSELESRTGPALLLSQLWVE